MNNEINDNGNNTILDNVETINSIKQTVDVGKKCAEKIAGEKNMQKYGGKILCSTTGTIVGSIVGSGIAVGLGLTLAPGFIIGGVVLGIGGLATGHSKDKKRLG